MVRTSHFLATAAVIADALPLAVAMPMQTMATNVLPNFSLSGMSNLLAFAQFMGGPRGPGDARPRRWVATGTSSDQTAALTNT